MELVVMRDSRTWPAEKNTECYIYAIEQQKNFDSF